MSSIDTCLYEIERLKELRDRAIAQRAAMEAALWRSEFLLKKIVEGRAIDLEEIVEFLSEPRHHPPTPGGAVKAQGEGATAASPGTDHVDI